MEVSEDVLSALGDYAARLCNVDYSTTEPHLIADILKTFKVEGQEKDKSFLEFDNWYKETLSWVVCNFAKSGANLSLGGVPFPEKTDDRLTALACFAAYMSMDLVSNALYLDSSYQYRGAKITIKCIKEAVLACFDRLCKNLLIEKCWDAVSLRDSIVKAADFAADYLTSQGDELLFEVTENHQHFIFWFFQGTLTGNLGHSQTFSEMQPSTTATTSKVLNDGGDDVVGLRNDIMKIKERVVRSQRNLDIIPIVGMGGIGKTTLARKVYTDRETVIPLFQVRAWIVVSRGFCERDVLLGLLESIAPIPDEVYKSDTEHLAEILYRRLKGWRYLIVLDDIWTKEAWKRIKLCFPDDNNGSRIILTSRLMEVASFIVDPENPPHIMNLLGIEDSWKLLCKRVYGKEPCPHHLINIGMQIAEKCQGLPLAIEVMAGHLSNIHGNNKTQECWEDVAKRVGFPTEVTQMESLSSILSISYNDLPQHLKACFITMVNFPKNFKISVQKLVRLWSAMGIFIPLRQKEQNKNCTEEEVAMNCFENLIGRSLIMVRDKKIDGTAKFCGIHDLLWDLSMTQFRKEGHYIFCDKLNNSGYKNDIDNCIDDDEDGKRYVTGISQTLIYFDRSFESDYPINSEMFKLLRVLDILNQSFDHFPVEITCLFNLRYLALATSGNIPESISQLSKLETLLNYHERAGQVLPKEIWLLPNLRHLHVGIRTYLSDPTPTSDDGFELLLSNLQALFSLSCSSCTKEVFSNIPNLKQLGIDEPEEEDDTGDELLSSALENLSDLEQLERLKLYCNPKLYRPRCIPEWGSFLPNTIKQLTLCACNLPWSQINGLAMLPNLEVLKLKDNAFAGQEWGMEDDQEFLKLKYLSMDWLDLIFWNANSENFPSLKFLRIRGCHNLYRIPSGFGEIYTLELIDLEFCNQVIYQSAIDIEREQINNVGNDKFILRTGRAHPQLQTSGFVMIFIWVAMQLNVFKPKKGFQVKKPRNPSRPRTGKLRLLG